MAVKRCVCFNASFERIVEIARETGSLVEAQKQTGFGGRCGLCVPYIQACFKTGSDDLPVMWAADFQALGISAGAIERLERWLAAQSSAPSTAV